MVKRIEGVTIRLLTCAKQEFLEKGFQAASIREIAKKADTSPRSIYTRFPDKNGLFDAIVAPVATEFKELLRAAHLNCYSDEIHSEIDLSSSQGFQDLMNYIYNHFDEFKLLITCSEGTEFSGFVDELAKMDISLNLQSSRNKKDSEDLTFTKTNQLLQLMLTKSFYNCMFEPIICDLSREDAMFYISKLSDFFSCGIAGILDD